MQKHISGYIFRLGKLEVENNYHQNLLQNWNYLGDEDELRQVYMHHIMPTACWVVSLSR